MNYANPLATSCDRRKYCCVPNAKASSSFSKIRARSAGGMWFSDFNFEISVVHHRVVFLGDNPPAAAERNAGTERSFVDAHERRRIKHI